jgi:uncharacterized protein (DUF1684 family)
MSEGVFLLPRIVDTADQTTCKQFVQSTAFGTAGIVVFAKPGRLYRLSVVNSAATRYFIQLHNKATAAVAAETPIWEEHLAASGGTVLDFGLNGLYFSAGCSLAISSTKSALTLALATDCAAYGLYAVKTST